MRSQVSKEAQDLEILQKEYRNMEANRRSFADESHLILRQQQQKLDKLRKENDSLKADVAKLQTRNYHQPMTQFEQDQLARLYEEMMRYSDLIDREKGTLQKITGQISERRQHIREHQQTMGGVHAAMENQRRVNNQVRMLENRLDQALVKFNKSVAKNKKLRQEIDDLRGERDAVGSVKKKLEKTLNDHKRQIEEVIGHSNMAFEQRDKARLEVMAIQQANRKEQEAFDLQMAEVARTLEELQQTTAEPKPNPAVTAAEEEARAEAERKAAIAAAQAKERKALAQKRKKQLQALEETFRKISVATGISDVGDVDELISSYIDNEEQNFSLYSYVNEQADEMELLEGQVQRLREEESRQAQEDGNGIDEYDQVLRSLDAKLKATREETEKMEGKCKDAQRTAESIKDATKLLLARMDCQEEIVGEEGITDSNILNCLGAIEEKVNDIIRQYHSVSCGKPRSSPRPRQHETSNSNAKVSNEISSPSRTSVLGEGPTKPMSPHPISVNPPKLADYFSDEDSGDEGGDGSRPLNRTELQKITANRLGNVQTQPVPRRVPMENGKGRQGVSGGPAGLDSSLNQDYSPAAIKDSPMHR